MSQDKKHSKHSVTEVELDAVDLAGLSPATAGPHLRSTPLAEQSSSPLVAYDEEIAALGMPIQSETMQSVLPKQRTGILGNRALGIFGLVLIAGAALVAHQVATSQPPSQRATLAWTPLPERAETAAMPEQDEEAPPAPTLFANPFDPSEVFELAPGLTQDEARQQVAQILLERARERMASR